MKLYLTLETDVGKIERVMIINEETMYKVNDMVSDMMDSAETIREATEEEKIEAQRLIQQDKAND